MNRKATVLEFRSSLKSWQHIAIFFLACAVQIARKPDSVFHPQFYGEDGRIWFADAYNLGWFPALFHTWSGYFQTFPRIAAALALHLPFARVPLFFNLVAICVEAVPISLLLSSRSTAWGSLRFRAMLAGIYLVLPNSDQMSCGITESLWFLALCSFLILVASAPKSAASWSFDLLILLLCGLTGPFCIFLLLIALFLAQKNRDRRHWALAALLASLSMIQVWALIHLRSSGDPFDHRLTGLKVMGPTPALFARILASQIYLGTLLGGNGFGAGNGAVAVLVFTCITLAGTALVIYCFLKASIEMRLFLAFASMPFAAALISCTGNPPPGVAVWTLFAASGGIRYWFLPTLAFAWTIVWCFEVRRGSPRTLAAALLCLMSVGVLRDLRHTPFKDVQFADSAARFNAAPAGSTVTIPENPDGWTAQLIKRYPTR